MVFRRYLSMNKSVEKASEPLGLAHQVLFTGEIKPKSGKSPGEITDPRDYLESIMKLNPKLLREDYRQIDDAPFAEVMELVKNQISHQVEYLCRIFGCAGLVDRVDRNSTIEEMAKRYS
jgi:uncharacterized protein (UPF0297 family)